MKFIALLLFSGSVLFQASSCKKGTDTDKEMLDMAKNTAGFVWYKFSDQLLPKSNFSGHNEAFLRTRYNTVAATMLDSTGKVKEGIIFPEGSFIVKELWNDASTLSTYAILWKQYSNEDADASGWVWGYIRPDGEVRESSKKKGEACIGCHSLSGNIDLTAMNVAFP